MMVDVRVPHRWLFDAAMVRLTPAQRWFHIALMLHSAEHETDGFVPAHMVPVITLGMCTPADLDVMVSAGVLRVVQDGYRIPAWGQTQTTRAEHEKRRVSARDRKRAQRARERGESPDGSDDESHSGGGEGSKMSHSAADGAFAASLVSTGIGGGAVTNMSRVTSEDKDKAEDEAEDRTGVGVDQSTGEVLPDFAPEHDEFGNVIGWKAVA